MIVYADGGANEYVPKKTVTNSQSIETNLRMFFFELMEQQRVYPVDVHWGFSRKRPRVN